MTLLDGIMAGTDCWLLNGEMSFEKYRDDPTVVSAMQQAAKRILWTAANYSDIMNGMDENTRVVKVIPDWQKLVYGADMLAAVLTIVSLGMLVLAGRKKK